VIGDQLELALEDERLNLPWNGQSPRALTRAAKSAIFKAQAAKGRPQMKDPAQLELFRVGEKRLPEYRGAPSLLPLPKRGDNVQ